MHQPIPSPVRTVICLGAVLALVAALLSLGLPARAAEAAGAASTTVLQEDTFSRVVARGWGEADTGGPWQLTTSQDASVDGAQARILVPRGEVRTAGLPGDVTGPMQAELSFVLPELPTAGDVTVGLEVRRQGGAFFYPRVRVDQQGDAFLGIVGQPDGASSWLLTREVPIGRTTGGGVITLRAATDLVAAGIVVAKAWLGAQSEPRWQLITGEPSLPDSGAVGIRMQSSVFASSLVVEVDDYSVVQVGSNQLPTAEFSVASDGLTVEVDGSASSDPDGTISEYIWEYGDGSTAEGARPAPKTYSDSGTYTVTLRVVDNDGGEDVATQEVTVDRNNVAPIPSFTVAIDALDVTVDASESVDSDGEIVSYVWDYGDGTTDEGVTASHTYTAAGTYDVTLTVTDDRGGSAADTQEVTVNANQAPTALITYTARGLRVLVGGGQSTDPDGEVVSYAWDFGNGATGEGVRPPVQTYPAAGDYTITLTVTDNRGATATTTRDISLSTAAVSQPGAKLPIVYNLSDLTGTKRFVSPTGSDENGDGSEGRPYRTLKKAVAVAAAGDSVVLRGGTYDITDNSTSIGKANMVITAYPGEKPVFDGSMAAPTQTTAEGNLKWFTYTPMRAKTGEGLNLSQLPEAKFDSNGNPTGLAAERGWRCVYGGGPDYDPPGSSGSGSRCPGGTKPYMIAGYYPDQVWVNGAHLTQVLDKSKVKKGSFYVERTAANDDDPGPSRLYLSGEDAADMAKVRVSSSSGNFIHVPADGVTLQGFKVERHSPAWPFFAITVTSAVNDLNVNNVELDYVTSVAAKVAGGDAGDQSGLTLNPTWDQVTITRSSWIGLSMLYVDNAVVSNSVIRESNYDREFNTAPKSGGIKATKTHDMLVVGSDISENNGHGIWWDQSNYNATLANSDLRENSDSAIFYEISYGLVMVNNVITRGASPSSSPTVRIAGGSNSTLVNNTIVGGQVPFALAGDPRSKFYGSNRPCSEHTERYRQGGNIGSDCPPALSSDLDKARPGAYGSPNLTPGLNWRPSADVLVNNILANPVAGSGGICPGGYPLCMKMYSGSSSNPDVVIPGTEVMPADVIMNGNVYQSANTAGEVLVQSGGKGGFTATTLDQLRGSNGFGSSYYNLKVDQTGLFGVDYVTPDGVPTEALAAIQDQAAPVPNNTRVNEFLPAGTKHYGAIREGGTGEIPADVPTAVIKGSIDGFTVQADASASTTNVGTIVTWAWDFGDDTGVQLGEQLEHVYDEPGTYQVTLVVLTDTGAFNYQQLVITIADPNVPAIADDTFTRLLPTGWGSADIGGNWEFNASAEKYLVTGQYGGMKLSPGVGLRALLKGLGAAEADLTVTTGSDQQATGGGVYVSAMPRVMADNSAYRAKVHFRSDNTAKLQLTRVDGSNKETVLVSAATALPGVTPGTPLKIRTQVTGSKPTTVRAKIWIDSEPEPTDWQVTATDNTAGLQGPGGVGLFAYESSSGTQPHNWYFDDLLVVPPSAG